MPKLISKALAACLAGAVLAGCSQDYVPPVTQIRAEAGRVTDPSEIVVLSDDAQSMRRLLSAAEPLGYGPLSDAEAGALGLNVLVLRIPEGRDGPTAIAELEALEPGIVAGVNHAFDSRGKGLMSMGRRYAGAMMRWPDGGCVARRPVGVIDAAPAGLRADVAGYRSFARGRASQDAHGWQVARIIADPSRLQAPEIHVADVVGMPNSGREEASVDAIVSALAWMQEQGVSLVNISLAGPYNKILDRTFAKAEALGMVIVAAAGNEGPESPPRFPAAFPGVIAVTAVDAAGASYPAATLGRHIDVAAPGVDIFLDGNYVSGTSFAAPFVTAYLAASDDGAQSVEAARRKLGQAQRSLGPQASLLGLPINLLDLGGACP